MATKKSELSRWLGREVEFIQWIARDYPVDEHGDPDYTRDPGHEKRTSRGWLREIDVARGSVGPGWCRVSEEPSRVDGGFGVRVHWREITPLPFDPKDPPLSHYDLSGRCVHAPDIPDSPEHRPPDGVVDLDQP